MRANLMRANFKRANIKRANVMRATIMRAIMESSRAASRDSAAPSPRMPARLAGKAADENKHEFCRGAQERLPAPAPMWKLGADQAVAAGRAATSATG